MNFTHFSATNLCGIIWGYGINEGLLDNEILFNLTY